MHLLGLVGAAGFEPARFRSTAFLGPRVFHFTKPPRWAVCSYVQMWTHRLFLKKVDYRDLATA